VIVTSALSRQPSDLASRSDHGRSPAAWLAAFHAQPSRQIDRELGLLDAPPEWCPALAEDPSCTVVFDGLLYNRTELREQLAERLPPNPSDAELVGRAYQRWGEDAIARLQGIFALIIADRDRHRLLCARDPLGIRPLFYAEVDRSVLLSPAIDRLLGHPGVSSQINRACLVDHVTKRWPANQETFFTQVRRVPPGHILHISGEARQARRYWNPVPLDDEVRWIPTDEVQGRFDAALRQAIARCLGLGRAGVYVSGGLDSSTLAMIAADLSGQQDGSAPCALSLVFSENDPDEPVRQRDLSAALGMPHVQCAYADAVGPEGTLAAALEMARSMPSPLWVMWRPALQYLAAQGREQGCGVVLAGDGADEWMWENPVIAADLLRAGDLAGLYRLWATYAYSYHFSRREAFRIVMRRHAIRYLWPDVYYAAAARLGAGRLVRNRWRAAALQAAGAPPWVVPDPALRTQWVERLEASYVRDATKARPRSYYLRDTQSRLDSADKWFREEETFVLGQRTGIPIREPFWDPDLIELLVRVRPQDRSAGGRAKGLVRGRLAERFPRLGFEAQRKSNLGNAFISVLATQAGAARRALGDFPTLVDLGVIDGAQVRVLLDDALAGRSHRDRIAWAWELLNLEAWARAHA
jgi:asparagine synthase (glutamine-hydrolysing)